DEKSDSVPMHGEVFVIGESQDGKLIVAGLLEDKTEIVLLAVTAQGEQKPQIIASADTGLLYFDAVSPYSSKAGEEGVQFVCSGTSRSEQAGSDVVLCRLEGSVLTVPVRIPIHKNAGIEFLASGDLDGDGQGEILAGADDHSREFGGFSMITVWQLSGKEAKKLTESAGHDMLSGMAAGDFDGDGKTEIAMAERVSDLNLYRYVKGKIERDPEAGARIGEPAGMGGDEPLLVRRRMGTQRADELIILDRARRLLLRSRLAHGRFAAPEVLVTFAPEVYAYSLQSPGPQRDGRPEKLFIGVRVKETDADGEVTKCLVYE
ncbi:MAG: FG-GAP-like repeat-containing protein, partial [Candidatus Hydrogenedentales bacterium]